MAQYMSIGKGQPWEPGFLGRAPWLGLSAILGALVGIIAAILVLVISNGQPVHNWVVQPTVYLAIASAATNIFLHFALTEAVNIAWWRRAMKKDTTIGDLHRSWDFKHSLWAALTSGRHFNRIALAAIFVALVPINGPLLQRASRPGPGHFEQDTDVQLVIAQKIPDGYTGYLSNRGHSPTLLAPPFVRVVQEFTQRSRISIADSGCTGSCNAKVAGAGLVANCSRSDHAFHLGNDASFEELVGGTVIFGSYFYWSGMPGSGNSTTPESVGTFNVGVQFKGTEDCDGTLTVRNCTFRPARVLYPVSIDGNTSSISLAADTTILDDKLLNVTVEPPADPMMISSSFNESTYGGFFLALSDTYSSTLEMDFGAIGFQIWSEGALSNQYLNTSQSLQKLNCTMSFYDPTDDIIAAARDLMFRTAIASSNDTLSADIQQVTARESFHKPIYTSSYSYLGLAILLSLFAWAAILPVFFGWWHLGRAVSMSPIETAKAFGAPDLRSGDSNADAHMILKEIGEREVRYGAVMSEAKGDTGYETPETMRLLISEPGLVRSPKPGERFVG